jgi:hypothetical protein
MKRFILVALMVMVLPLAAFAGDMQVGHARNGQTVPMQGPAPYAVGNHTISSDAGVSITFTDQKWFCITPEIDVKLFYGDDATNYVHINANEHFGRIIGVSKIKVTPFTSGATGVFQVEYN